MFWKTRLDFALPVEGAEERLATARRLLVATLGASAVLRNRLFAEHVFSVLQSTPNRLLVAYCGGRHHHRRNAAKTASFSSVIPGWLLPAV
jgi:hypothetical protein